MMKTLRVVCLYFASESDGLQRIPEIAESCLRWTPQIAITDRAVFLEIGRSLHLYREESIRLRLIALIRRFFGEKARVGIGFAEDAPTALALARSGGDSREQKAGGHAENAKIRASLPLEALQDYVNPFGLAQDDLGSLAAISSSLRKLGVMTIGDFLALPPQSLPSRFGKLGILVHQRVREAASLPWPRFVALPRIFERTSFETSQPFHDLEPVFFFLKPMIDRAMARLRGKVERASKVRVALHLERYSTTVGAPVREWTFDLALPQGSTLGLLPILRERLHFQLGQTPLEAPVTDLEFEVLETVPGQGAQRDFFDAREEELEAWNSLVSRLSEKLGEGKVFIAEPMERYLPEKAWAKKLWKTGDGKTPSDPDPIADRPLRLLKHPVPLQRSGTTLAYSTSLTTSRYCRPKAWRMVASEGPEVLSGEWWFQQSQRNYFRIATEGGEELWVFQSPGSETLYLHGFFD